MAEWLKAAVLKTASPATRRGGGESEHILLLRHAPRGVHGSSKPYSEIIKALCPMRYALCL